MEFSVLYLLFATPSFHGAEAPLWIGPPPPLPRPLGSVRKTRSEDACIESDPGILAGRLDVTSSTSGLSSSLASNLILHQDPFVITSLLLKLIVYQVLFAAVHADRAGALTVTYTSPQPCDKQSGLSRCTAVLRTVKKQKAKG